MLGYRVVYRLFAFCTHEASLKSTSSALSFTEICTPIPATKDLWHAPSAAQWRDLYLLRVGNVGASSAKNIITLLDCLQRPSIFQEFPSSLDRELAFNAVLYSTMNMIHDAYSHRRALEGAMSAEIMLAIGSETPSNQERHILRLIYGTRSMWDIGALKQSAPVAVLLELTSMRSITPLDKMEMLLHNNDKDASSDSSSALQEWTGSRAGRKAVWHAGQVIRFIRLVEDSELEDFLAVAVYQAALCLWTYRGFCQEVTLQAVNPSHADTMPHSQTLHGSPDLGHLSRGVHVDGCESLATQKWINLGGSVPVISISMAHQLSGIVPESDVVPLCADPDTTHCFIQAIVDLLSTKFTGSGAHIQISEAICQMFRAFGKLG